MAAMTLYHGSPEIVQKPSPSLGKLYADFGRGFYCTAQKELAKEWACRDGTDGFSGQYELNCDGLSIYRFGDDAASALSWLQLVFSCRELAMTSHVPQKGLIWLKDCFPFDASGYDVIIGHRCDDSYFSLARAFLCGDISLRQLRSCLAFDKAAEQVAVISPAAFTQLRFISCEPGDHAIYAPRRMARDLRLRAHMKRLADRDELGALYMRDIIREEVKPDDPRLR